MQHRFEDAVEAILSRHPEYSAEAYSFIRQALDVTTEQLHKDASSAHLSAEELYKGAAAHALEEYGPLARLVLARWGIQDCRDVGAIVYNLIEVGVFGRQEGDTREQFDHLQSLEELLEAPFKAPETSKKSQSSHPS